MLTRLKRIDGFTRNILVVFAGTSLVNFFNLLYQLLIAHRLSATDFAVFNSLISVFMLISAPFGTIQIAVAKYTSHFRAHNQVSKLRFLLTDAFRKASLLALGALVIFSVISVPLTNALKIPVSTSGYILALLVATATLQPVFLGGVQGMELFGWMSSASVLGGALKLSLAFIFLSLGLRISGALSALCFANLGALCILGFSLRHLFDFKGQKEDIRYGEILLFIFPVALSYFCFNILTNADMVFVKYLFSETDAGFYSLSQMVGKIFLFLPGAVSMVMFPRTSGLSARNMDTTATLAKSLVFVLFLSGAGMLVYNLFPALALSVLTGKAFAESVYLGRFFSFSMTFFALDFVMISYFLSIKDYRFIKYLVCFALVAVASLAIFHQSLAQVQLLLCVNSVALFLVMLGLVYGKRLHAKIKR